LHGNIDQTLNAHCSPKTAALKIIGMINLIIEVLLDLIKGFRFFIKFLILCIVSHLA